MIKLTNYLDVISFIFIVIFLVTVLIILVVVANLIVGILIPVNSRKARQALVHAGCDVVWHFTQVVSTQTINPILHE